ncbi:MAG: hypothetical protein IK003_08295 [Prevotella sp.]|nr:hypothetical protein [Prevotella sp.]
MNRITRNVAVATLVLTLSACGSYKSVASYTRHIEPNMTKEEVKSAVGKADYRSFEGNTERWEYRSRDIYDDFDVVIVEFVNGRVVAMDSFHEVHPKFPEPQKDK